MVNGYSRTSIESDLSTASSINQSNASQETTIYNCEPSDVNDEIRKHKKHSRSVSISQAVTASSRCDKFQASEVQDILLCFLFVVKYLEDNRMILWWQQCNEIEIQKFLSILE